MSENMIRKMIGETFLEVADALESGSFCKKPVIGVASEGSEHGAEILEEGIRQAEKKGFKAILIEGDDVHKQMEDMLENGEIQGAITMHYPFPIGVSTVGKVITPAQGIPMYIATTTGTSHTDRVVAMVKNAIYGIIAAKADGVENPTVGIANVDGARQTEKALMQLEEKGYNINWATSKRAEGGAVMRGNDMLMASADVMVMDSLTGNLMMKMFSAFTTGGNYEASGWGYGPGIGEEHDKLVMIISRASGAPVIAGAIEYATTLSNNDWWKVSRKEFEKANKAGLQQILSEIKAVKKPPEALEEVTAPPKEVVTSQISGIEVMDLEDAVMALWKENVYAESGMGCTGPIVLISGENADKAQDILKQKGFISS